MASFRALLSQQPQPLRATSKQRPTGRLNCINVAYYRTMLVLGAGLTALLGYEIGWLAAHSLASLVAAAAVVPWMVFLAGTISDAR